MAGSFLVRCSRGHIYHLERSQRLQGGLNLQGKPGSDSLTLFPWSLKALLGFVNETYAAPKLKGGPLRKNSSPYRGPPFMLST